MTQRIAPNRHNAVVDEGGRFVRRSADVIEDLVNDVNDLMALPINTQDSSYTFLLTDAGKIIRKTSTTLLQTYTIPANSSAAFDLGTEIQVQNDGTVALSIAIDSDTLTSSAGLGVGTRILGASGEARLTKVTATSWKISGEQVT